VHDVAVKKFKFAVSSRDELLVLFCSLFCSLSYSFGLVRCASPSVGMQAIASKELSVETNDYVGGLAYG